jgi:alpha 1,3-mannosyltransferase
MAPRPRFVLTMLSALSAYSIFQYLPPSLAPRWRGGRLASRRPRLVILAVVCLIALITRLWTTSSTQSTRDQLIGMTARTAQYFLDYPAPIEEFGEMGRRVQFLTEALMIRDRMGHDVSRDNQTFLLEDLAASLFPFIRKPSRLDDLIPLTTLRRDFVPKSKGIVITTGKDTFRYAAHLIANLRDVLESKLPIQIVYLGDSDLPMEYRQALVQLGKNIETLDIQSVTGESILDPENPGWAIKPFGLLFSKFEQTIIVDADAIFLQKPEVIFNKHKGYRRTGTLLFRDRPVGKGDYAQRHEWLNHQLRHHKPSETRLKSIMLNDGYGQEAESGVVVLDKGRLGVLSALLHACWQNSGHVRELHTYVHTYGYKETYWLGLELTEVPYIFAEHYAAALGVEVGENRVCGSHQAHLDEKGKLIWFNGSLLKNRWGSLRQFMYADRLSVDGNWQWDLTTDHTSCMEEGTTKPLDRREQNILEKSRRAAMELDEKFSQLINLPPEISAEEAAGASSGSSPRNLSS